MSIPPAPFQWPRWNLCNQGSRTVHPQCPAEWGCPCHPLRCHPKSASLTASPSPVTIAFSSRSNSEGALDEWKQERSEEHTSELQSPCNLVCRLLLEKKKNTII